MPEVSVVVVSYNTRDLLRRCLASLGEDFEAIVVDNASSDGSGEMVATEFPTAKLIRNAENRGFGAANNQGLDLATAPLVLYLNSDAYAAPGSITALASVFKEPGVAAAGGKLLNPDGSLQESASGPLTLWAVLCEQLYLEKFFPGSRLFSPYWLSKRLLAKDPGANAAVDQVMGACLMTRKQERFDERFFLYVEDTELNYRLKKRGKILYVPTAAFYHELGSSSNPARWTAIARYNRGKELFFTLHKGRLQAFLVLVLNRLGALLRLTFWGFGALLTFGKNERYQNQAKAFWQVLTSPRLGPPPHPPRTPSPP